jgi:hypothetical protein
MAQFYNKNLFNVSEVHGKIKGFNIKEVIDVMVENEYFIDSLGI